jgi:hypothetical protein
MPPLPVPAPELPPPPPELPPPAPELPPPPPELPPPELPPPELPPLELPPPELLLPPELPLAPLEPAPPLELAPPELLLALEFGAELAGWLTAGAVLCTTGRGFGGGRRIGGSAEVAVLAGAEIDTCEVLSASGAGAGADV